MLLPAAANAQAGYKSEEELIKSAENYFDDKNYEKAFPLFSQIVSNRPDNAHYNYCLGVCIMKAGADKAEAIRFLDIATKSPQNPADVWLYLGNAFHFSYRYDEAIAAYESYKSAAGKSSWNSAKGDLLIKMCRNGIQVKNDLSLNRHRILEKSEIEWADFYTLYRNLGDWGRFLKLPKEYEDKNTKERPESAYLFLSTKGNVMMYSNAGKSSDKGFDIFKVIKDQKGMWMFPEALAEIINTSGDEAFPVIINEGKTIFFSSKGERSTGGYDVFRSDFDAATGRWSDPVSMGPPVNSPADDYYYVPSADQSIAYFASNRESQGTKCYVYKASINKEDKNYVTINGLFNCAAGLELSDARVTVLDPSTSAIVAEFRTASQQGTYFLKLPAGSTYVYRVELVGFNTQEDVMDLTSNTAPELIQEILLVRNDQGKENMTITNRVPERSQTVAANKPGQLLQVGENNQLSPASSLSENDRMVAMRSPGNNSSTAGKSEPENGTISDSNPQKEVNSGNASNSNAPVAEHTSNETREQSHAASTKNEPANGGSKSSAPNSGSGKIENGNNVSADNKQQQVEPVAMNASPDSDRGKATKENQFPKGTGANSNQTPSQNASLTEASDVKGSAAIPNTTTQTTAAGNGAASPTGTQTKSQAAGNTDASATEQTKLAASGNENVTHDSSKSIGDNSNAKNEQKSPVANGINPAPVKSGADGTSGKGNDSPVALNATKISDAQQEPGNGTSQNDVAENGNAKSNSPTKPESVKANSSGSGSQSAAPSSTTGTKGAVSAKDAVSANNGSGKTEGIASAASPSASEKVQPNSTNTNTTSAPVAMKSASTEASNSELKGESTSLASENKGTQKTNSGSPALSTAAPSSATTTTQVAMNNESNTGVASEQAKTATKNQSSDKAIDKPVATNNQNSSAGQQQSSDAGASDPSLALNGTQEQKIASGSSRQSAATPKTDNKPEPSNATNEIKGDVGATKTPASAMNNNTGSSKSDVDSNGGKGNTYHLPAEQPVSANQGKSAGSNNDVNSNGASSHAGNVNVQPTQSSRNVESNSNGMPSVVKQTDNTVEPSSEALAAENGKKSRKGGLFGRRNKDNNDEPAVAEVPVAPVQAAPEVEEELYKNLVFRVQLGAYKDRNVEELRQKYTAMGLTDLVYVKNETGLLLVMTGSENSYTNAIALKEAMIAKGVSDAFVVVYSEGARLPVQMVVRVDE